METRQTTVRSNRRQGLLTTLKKKIFFSRHRDMITGPGHPWLQGRCAGDYTLYTTNKKKFFKNLGAHGNTPDNSPLNPSRKPGQKLPPHYSL